MANEGYERSVEWVQIDADGGALGPLLNAAMPPATVQASTLCYARAEDRLWLCVVSNPVTSARLWVAIGAGPGNASGRSTLTLDPLGVAAPGVYTTWASLWAAYQQTTGAVGIWVLNQATVPAGTYVLRSGTVLYGVLRPGIGYDLELAEGAVLQDLEHLVSLSLRSVATATTPLTFSSPGPGLLLDDGSNLVNTGTVPMIDWTVDGSGGNTFFLVLVRGPQLLNVGGSPVIYAHGPGPGQPAVVGIIMGDNSVIGPSSLQGSVDSVINLISISPTSFLDPSQPLYLSLPPFPRMITNFSTRTSMQLPGTNNPQSSNIVAEHVTIDASLQSLMPPENIPAMGQNQLVLVTAHRGSDGATASWFQQIHASSFGGAVTLLATDVTPPNTAALAGVTFNAVPVGATIDYQIQGVVGDPIRWTMRVLAGLSFA